jgi:hypothetical protein
MTATRPGGRPLCSDPADPAAENRELHQLRELRAALLARCDQLDQGYGAHPVLWTSEIRELLEEAQR